MIKKEVARRRACLAQGFARRMPDDMRAGSSEIWGLALSGGGIRSATFCLGLIKALAAKKLLLRFDLISTVSGGGYIGAMLGNLFNRARSARQVQLIEKVIGDGQPSWFLWWLRANGRYLIPRGMQDRLFAVALYVRNLVAIHFELGVIALMLGFLLVLVDLAGWGAIDGLGFVFSTEIFFGWLRWLPVWFPVTWLCLPIVVCFCGVQAVAYWYLPWVASTDQRPSIFWSVWTAVLVFAVGLGALFLLLAELPGAGGSALRRTLHCLIIGLIVVWLLGVLLARAALRSEGNTTNPELKGDTERNKLTKALAVSLRCIGLVVLLGAIDRLAWFFAFEQNNVGKVGAALAVSAGVLRAILPLMPVHSSGKTAVSLLTVGNVLGGVLTFLLCAWWVSLIHRSVLSALFAEQSLLFAHALLAWCELALPVMVYAVVTGWDFGFLNLSSLHAFYKARLIRSYLGASNPERFNLTILLGALKRVPQAWPVSVSSASSIAEVKPGDDYQLEHYRPQRFGGPIHLLNVCVNQTKDPRGGIFNQDRQGLHLAVASGGFVQASQDGWKEFLTNKSLSIGTWVAISGAAVAPGLGAMTRGGLAALSTFAGLRLGYWWSAPSAIWAVGPQLPAPAAGVMPWSKGRLLAKYRGILAETFGTFRGTAGRDWFLSDGGHFDNTAAYALIAEHAQVIVLADCGTDPDFAFCDLENLVRKARIDFRAEIYFQRPLAPVKSPFLSWPTAMSAFGSLSDLKSSTNSACLALARIVYGDGHPEGILILVKPNLCAGLPVDLVNFKAQNEDFPQQTTVDQFFSEAQWESYFLLGQFMGGQLDASFIQKLLDNRHHCFEDDDRPPFEIGRDAGTAANEMADLNETRSRLSARLSTKVVVGATTFGLGAIGTVGVSVWQAIESTHVSASVQAAQGQIALKELTDLWSRLPTQGDAQALASVASSGTSSAGDSRAGGMPTNATTSSSYNALAALLIRTADTLCPVGEASSVNSTRLASLIVSRTLEGCKYLQLSSLHHAASYSPPQPLATIASFHIACFRHRLRLIAPCRRATGAMTTQRMRTTHLCIHAIQRASSS